MIEEKVKLIPMTYDKMFKSVLTSKEARGYLVEIISDITGLPKNKIEKDMIIKHMWPVTLAIPRYPQTFILTLVDKYCATMESFEEMFSGFSVRKALHYSYVFLALVIFKRKP